MEVSCGDRTELYAPQGLDWRGQAAVLRVAVAKTPEASTAEGVGILIGYHNGVVVAHIDEENALALQPVKKSPRGNDD